MSNPYEVGYKKPPKKTQFKEGVSGNPDGRPPNKTKLNVIDVNSTVIKQLQKKNRVLLNGKSTDLTNLEALVLSIINSAIKKGDVKTMRWILDVFDKARLEGSDVTSLFRK